MAETETTAPTEETTKTTPRAPAVSNDAKIKLGKDKDGKAYGPDNNPKRPGSAAADRFAKYKNGMTVAKAIEAGVSRGDVNWDIKRGYISVE